MIADPSNVIVIENGCNTCGADTIEVHHQSFPELRVSGRTPAEAATRLADRLSSDLDAVVDPVHRDPVSQALADVHGFLDRARGVAAHDH